MLSFNAACLASRIATICCRVRARQLALSWRAHRACRCQRDIVSRSLPLGSTAKHSAQVVIPTLGHVAHPLRSIETRSLPNLLVATLATFTLITRTAPRSRQLPSWVAVYRRESRSRRVLCLARHRLGEGGSLISSAPFPICGNRRPCARCNREKILLRRSSLRSRFGGVGGYGETSVVVQVPTGSGKTY